MSFTSLHQAYLEQINGEIEKLESQDRERRLTRLLWLEEKTKLWLDEGIDNLTQKAMKKLKIFDMKHVGRTNALKDNPIRALVGVTTRTSPSKLVSDLSEASQNSSNAPDKKEFTIKIDLEEFESEESFSGDSRRYGVYEVLMIFLCANFLTYYRCYYNFIRNKTVDEESCEYLYDSIVSTKIEEDSSVRLNDDDSKNVYGKRLLIATQDGRNICFWIQRHRIERSLSLKLSDVDSAAISIRDMLRQRRVDM